MKLILSHLSPLLFALLLAAPPAAAQDPGIRASYQRNSSGHRFGVEVSIGGQRSERSRFSRRACPPSRGYTRRESVRQVWVPGHYELVQRRVWVPGAYRQVWVPPVYETRYDYFGRPFQVLIMPGHHVTVQDPGHWEYRDERVWRDPHWEIRS